MSKPNTSKFTVTHIGTATAIFAIDNVNILTDPMFSPAGTKWDFNGFELQNTDTPALTLGDLPPIDAVLLSHEDHADNLDAYGRQLLDGRHVFTTIDGQKNLAPRSGVRGMKPWQKTTVQLGGKEFEIIATPCKHFPGGECTGFIVATESFGTHADGRPNAIYFTGDTVYINELDRIPKHYNILAAVMNFGSAYVPVDGGMHITMDGKQGAQLLRALNTDCLVPMHFESWKHFSQLGKELAADFKAEGITEKVKWLTPGKPVNIF